MAGEEKQIVVEETTVVPGKMEFRLISPTESNFLKHIEWNKEELLAAVRSKVALYEGIVYTEETVKTAKNDRAELNNLVKLEGIGNDKIIDMVMRFEKTAADEGKDLVLLCYEDVRIPEDWCHRTVFAQWYCEMTGEIIEELPDPNPPKVKKPPVQKQAKKEESKRTAAQKEAKMETEGYEQMSLFGMAGAMI